MPRNFGVDGPLQLHCLPQPGETEQDFYVGARQDRLRRVDGAWKIADRRMTLDQNVLTAKNLSIFF